MRWIIDHTWSLPLAVTILMFVLFVWGAASTKTGEDAMMLPVVLMFALSAITVAWAIWAVGKFVFWLM